jgi:hypothetical protein
MKTFVHSLASLCLALGLFTPRSLGALPKTEGPSAQDPGVVGGSAVTACNWPTTVVLPTSGCSGTLIHPRVVTTAAHCEPRSNELIAFGETTSAARISVRATKCVTSGRSPDLTRDDWAYCVLPDDRSCRLS